MDLPLADMSGIDAVVTIRSRFPEARFIILSTFAGDAEIQRALEAGARAYLLKTVSPQEMMDVIRQVHAGKRKIPSEVAAHLAEHYSDERLSGREVDVLRQLAGGTAIGTSPTSCLSRKKPLKLTSSTSWRNSAPVIAHRRSPLAFGGESFRFESFWKKKREVVCFLLH